jgi:hypothetical protein
VAGGEVSGGPGGPTPYYGAAWPWPCHHVVWWHGGSPGVSQVPLCPKFDIKILKEFSRIF